ncbi:MAG: glycerol-3-phosphate cytidylyltransferase [Candidatus Sabulitectum sp.]|nr:glycerol-3-phosphate cytidylyltransferase [Candidatus Sabulitectum sp.]
MKRVITYGTYDLFHIGHLNMLRRARALGDYLMVAISTDEFNTGKHKQCVYPYAHRAQIVEAIRFVDRVIPETSWEQKTEDIVNHSIDVFVIGDDWIGKFDFLKDYCEVIYLPRTESISTTAIKNTVQNGKSISR